MSQEQKVYVPKCSVKTKTFDSGKSILKIGLHAETMIAFLKQHANEKGYVNLGLSERREVSQYGESHCLWLDTWKPDASKAATRPTSPAATAAPVAGDDSDPVPF